METNSLFIIILIEEKRKNANTNIFFYHFYYLKSIFLCTDNNNNSLKLIKSNISGKSTVITVTSLLDILSQLSISANKTKLSVK